MLYSQYEYIDPRLMKNDRTGFENVNQSDYFGGYPTALRWCKFATCAVRKSSTIGRRHRSSTSAERVVPLN